VELGYVVAPAARATRGHRSASVATEWAVADLEAVRTELWLVASTKPRNGRGALRLRAGSVLRSVYFQQGQRRDVEIWSRLVTDP
jgi:hypothetical protein